MKTLILAAALGAGGVSALAQGALNFANYGGGVNAPVTDLGGTHGLNGPGFVADLYWTKGSVLDLAPLGQPAPFWTNGIFAGGERIIPGAAAGETITVQVRIWDVADSPFWTPGLLYSSTAWVAESAPFSITLTSAPDPPALLTGLQPFKVGFCLSCPFPPQPSLRVATDSTDGKKLLFSWTAYAAAEYLVQQNADLNTTNWMTLTNEPALVGLTNEIQFQLVTPAPSGTMFYRLRPQ